MQTHMNADTKETIRRIEETTAFYLRELETLTMEQLLRKPSEEEWSIGQMLLHLVQSALFMQLRNAASLLAGQGDTDAERSEACAAMFASGSFPPVRIQVPPSPQYTPKQPESKEQLIQGLQAVVQKMKELEPAIDQAPPHRTVAHPRLGSMNAKEWFLLVEMHYRHHLRQLDRLKAELS